MGTIEATGLDGGKIALADADINAFRAKLRGSLILAGAEGFADATKIWNGMIRARPAIVVRALGVADVIECVRFASDKGIRISPKGGGHNIAGTSLPDGGLTVDMSLMRGVLVDREQKIARCQAGCLLGDVDRETQIHGLAATLGFVSETGIAGLTLGGGFGYLTRKYGWTVDTLVELEVVSAQGEVLRVNDRDNPELFWAMRGGGGNFGIATTFTYKLHPVGPLITGGMIAFPGERAEEVLYTFRHLTSTSPRELTLATNIRKAPPAPFIPKEWHGKGMIGVVVCHTGSKEQAETDLAPLKKLGNPIADLVTQRPYVVQQSLLDATQPKGLCYYWKSEYVPKPSDALLTAFREHGAASTSMLSQMVMFHIGGAITERKADDGAVGNRDAEHMLGVAGTWQPNDPDAEKHLAWVRQGWEKIKPHSTGGVYVNFLTEEEGEDRVRASYGANFQRLAQVKKTYDPSNLFNSNKNIAPGR